MTKPTEQVRAEYRAAPTPLEWLQQEIADYFAADAPDAPARATVVDAVRVTAEQSLHEWTSTQLGPSELTEFRFSVHDAAGDETYSVFTSLPSPLALLEAALAECDEGDLVRVQHRYAAGGEAQMEAIWPFGLDEAVRLTRPLGGVLGIPEAAPPHESSMRSPAAWELPAPTRRALGILAGLLGAGLVASRRGRR